MSFLHKVAVVTGVGSGIGRATAQRFIREGIRGLVLVDNNEDALNATVNSLGGNNKVIGLVGDVSKREDCKKMIEIATSEFGQLNILFNNAGIMHPNDGTDQETSDEVWDKTMDINVKGVWYGCQYGIPAMLDSGGGSIINTASFVSLLGAATSQLAYTASKGAVLSMTKELATIYARDNIRVNALCPGPLNTPLLQKFLDTEEKRQRRLVHVPMGRFGLAEEMANAATFLASDESSYMTGSTFAVDGGITSAYVTSDKQVDPFGGPKIEN
jgi:NAD(P)-dependent dehydrogenase (short-subunit alcohol dehydrogenase family)